MTYLLSIIVFLPLFFLLIFCFVPSQQSKIFKMGSVAVTFIQFVLSLVAYLVLPKGEQALIGITDMATLGLVEKYTWIDVQIGQLGRFKIDYFLGIDGLNAALFVLSTFVLWIGSVSSWEIQEKEKGYFSLYMLLSTSVTGCFVALDFFLFFLFFEFMLLPMYFLIGLWGGKRREYAAVKFFIYTFLGSIFILIVLIGLYLSTQSFDMLAMTQLANFRPDTVFHPANDFTLFSFSTREWAFILLFLGFIIKLPAVPMHTWLPDAHVEAPTPISVVLAGILLKVGGYGLIRTAYCIFPEIAFQFSFYVALIGVLSMLYGAFVALGQTNLKRMIAYSSVSHMGFILLGLASATVEGINGAIYQLFSHGILSSMLFLCAGVIYSRTHHLEMENYRGLASKMPQYAVLVTLAFFASLGLPTFSGFIGELMVFLGAFEAGAVGTLPLWLPMLSIFTLLIGAGYFLWTLQKMFFGKFSVKESIRVEALTDLTIREKLMLVTLGVLAVVFGLFPSLILNVSNSSVEYLVKILQAK
ncbi:NADH dehydrogenase subunit M [Thermoflexibacter ruber]|uniref:NADH dehydrogenase subunit M n=2 Tax=Thermoflexibacter ruber TaxID=1003 RepID=A0A1I2A8L5_9BACT|nr:NADH dehydrogenase subunit M [Thermoflexibacter ruber]